MNKRLIACDPARYGDWGCAVTYIKDEDGTITIEKVETLPPAAPAEKPKEDEKEEESEEEIRKRARKPPSEGPCKMCGQPKPLNRLLLCYECWLKDKLHKDSGGDWLPGDPHPAGCGCDGPGGCSTKNQGN